MRMCLGPLCAAWAWPAMLQAAVPPEAAWQARCVQRMEKAIADLQKSDPGFSASRVTAPYESNHEGKYNDRTPGLEVRVQRPGQSAFDVPFSVTVHLELTGHRLPDVGAAWASLWGRELAPNRRYFWARESKELVALDTAEDLSVWRYYYSRRQGNVVAFLVGEHSVERADVLRRLVALFEPATDDCLTWGKDLSAIVSSHPVAEVPLSPLEPSPAVALPQEPPLQLSVYSTTKLRIQIFNSSGNVTYRCDYVPSPRGTSSLKTGCPPPRGWFADTDTFLNRLPRIEVAQGARKTHRTIFADGSEERIRAVISPPGSADAISIVRVLRASSDVILEPAWQPTAQGTPLYRLTNRSPRNLYGQGIFGNFFGTLERWTGSTWEEVPASLCGTVNPEGPLPPGHSTMVDLGCVIDRAALTPGRHRFFLTYAHRGHALQTLAGSGDAFALWSEFTLPAPATPATPLPSPTAPAR